MKFTIHIFCDIGYEQWIFQKFKHKFANHNFLNVNGIFRTMFIIREIKL